MKRIAKKEGEKIGLELGKKYIIKKDPESDGYYITDCGIYFLRGNLKHYFI